MSNLHFLRRVAPTVVVIVLAASACSGGHKPRSITGGSGIISNEVDTTGTTDVTGKLQSFFLQKPKSGSTIYLQKDAHYLISSTILLADKNGLTVDGNGATITFAGSDKCPVPEGAGKPPPRSNPMVRVKNSTDVAITDLTLIGANSNGGVKGVYCPPFESQHGIEIDSTIGAKLDEVHVSKVWGDCVYIGQYTINHPSGNVLVKDSDCTTTGRQGISVTAASNVVIWRNDIRDVRRSTIDLEANSPRAGVDQVTIDRNTIGTGNLNFVAAHGQGPVDNVYIHLNTLTDHLLSINALTPSSTPRQNWVITANTALLTAQSTTIQLRGIKGVYIEGNRQDINGVKSVVTFANVCVSKAVRNSFRIPLTGTTQCPMPRLSPAIPKIMGETVDY